MMLFSLLFLTGGFAKVKLGVHKLTGEKVRETFHFLFFVIFKDYIAEYNMYNTNSYIIVPVSTVQYYIGYMFLFVRA